MNLFYPQAIWGGILGIPYMYDKAGIGPILLLLLVITIDLAVTAVAYLSILVALRLIGLKLLRRLQQDCSTFEQKNAQYVKLLKPLQGVLRGVVVPFFAFKILAAAVGPLFGWTDKSQKRREKVSLRINKNSVHVYVEYLKLYERFLIVLALYQPIGGLILLVNYQAWKLYIFTKLKFSRLFRTPNATEEIRSNLHEKFAHHLMQINI
ncbi:MAG: hypothetical protein ORN98_04555 [Alphaproteobacteria bacterium]|nr:hypothetical protein [Alphaproteobacteria bacterium]